MHHYSAILNGMLFFGANPYGGAPTILLRQYLWPLI